MTRLTLIIAALAGFATPASAINCDVVYKEFWLKMSAKESTKQLSGAQYARLSRTALRGYDACNASDERFTNEEFFRQLGSVNSEVADDILKELDKTFPKRK